MVCQGRGKLTKGVQLTFAKSGVLEGFPPRHFPVVIWSIDLYGLIYCKK